MPNFGTPLTRIVALAPYGALPTVPVAGPACVPRPTEGKFRHTPYEDRCPDPTRSSSEGPSGRVRMRPQGNFRHTPHEDRGPGPIGSSTEGPPKLHFGIPLTRIVALAPCGALPKIPVAGPACVPRPNLAPPLMGIEALAPDGAPPKAHRSFIWAHPSRGSWPWPHTELFRRSQWQGPRASPGQFRHTPHEDRGPGPIGSSTEGLSKLHFGTPLTRIVALAA